MKSKAREKTTFFVIIIRKKKKKFLLRRRRRGKRGWVPRMMESQQEETFSFRVLEKKKVHTNAPSQKMISQERTTKARARGCVCVRV